MAQRQAGEYHDFLWWLFKWGGLLILAWWLLWKVWPGTAGEIWLHVTIGGKILFNFVFVHEVFGHTLFGWGLLVVTILAIIFVGLAVLFKAHGLVRWLLK